MIKYFIAGSAAGIGILSDAPFIRSMWAEILSRIGLTGDQWSPNPTIGPPGFEMRTHTVYLEVKINGSTPQERDS